MVGRTGEVGRCWQERHGIGDWEKLGHGKGRHFRQGDMYLEALVWCGGDRDRQRVGK